MRIFLCSTFQDRDAGPTDAMIVTSDEWRALELVRRELVHAAREVCVEIREGGRVVWSGLA